MKVSAIIYIQHCNISVTINEDSKLKCTTQNIMQYVNLETSFKFTNKYMTNNWQINSPLWIYVIIEYLLYCPCSSCHFTNQEEIWNPYIPYSTARFISRLLLPYKMFVNQWRVLELILFVRKHLSCGYL